MPKKVVPFAARQVDSIEVTIRRDLRGDYRIKASSARVSSDAESATVDSFSGAIALEDTSASERSIGFPQVPSPWTASPAKIARKRRGDSPCAGNHKGPHHRYKRILFMLTGTFSGLAAIVQTSRISTARPNMAFGWELEIVTGFLLILAILLPSGLGRLRAYLLGHRTARAAEAE